MEKERKEINPEWEEYYKILETIRRSGKINMWGASKYLSQETGINEKLAEEILNSWISNYTELSKKYDWDQEK